ncbi:GNAT family N-acetyltransferase [Leifsonia sp. NPDC058292]|uniref:GNAT family N-acetyltransferase n=1 Tax=Leifsonia sp. NPDC058292 TaxID=3346428 RepID=UPI0036DE4F0D
MSLTVVKEPDASRYVLLRDGERIGIAEYELGDGVIDFVHTEIDKGQREKGLASTLVQQALDDVRDDTDLRVAASCPYVRHWLGEHPEYQDLQQREAASGSPSPR